MTSHGGSHGTPREKPLALGQVLLLAGATALSVALSFGFSRLSGELAERLSHPVGVPALVVGVALTLWAPRRFGWQWGMTGHNGGIVVGSMAAVVALVAGYRQLAAAVPYSPSFAEVVVVPLGEEALFRGFLLTALVSVFARRVQSVSAARWGVAVAALAFGVGHLGNISYVPTGFVLVQVLAATLFGLVTGWLRLRTESLVGPVLVHAAMNAAATL